MKRCIRMQNVGRRGLRRDAGREKVCALIGQEEENLGDARENAVVIAIRNHKRGILCTFYTQDQQYGKRPPIMTNTVLETEVQKWARDVKLRAREARVHEAKVQNARESS